MYTMTILPVGRTAGVLTVTNKLNNKSKNHIIKKYVYTTTLHQMFGTSCLFY